MIPEARREEKQRQQRSTPLGRTSMLYTDKKKEIKFSSYFRKFRMEQLQTASSYMVKNLRIFPHILISFSSYMTLQLLHSEIPYILYEENLILFLSVYTSKIRELLVTEEI